MTDAADMSSPAHGVADWPFGRGARAPARPGSLPDGRPWPRIRIVTVAGADPALAETVASVLRQGYQELRHDVLDPTDGRAAAARVLADPDPHHLLWLRAGDLLAPGALTALALEAALSGADAVAGLRVLFDDAVRGLDGPEAAGGGILWRRDALAGHAVLDADGVLDAATAWSTIAADRRSVIGRPVLLHRLSAAPPPPAAGLSIVSLTGTGARGGAGVAQRRLAEALTLAGHRITEVTLSGRPEAAEWSDDFPRAEAAIAAAAPDLVLAGNLHGATRSLDVVGRLARRGPVGLVLHDLFPLTGRCAHPRDCGRAASGCDAACPGPDEYPELAPGRIAGMHDRKRAVLAGASPGSPTKSSAPWLLANSDWTLARARELAPPGSVIEPVRLAFPTAVFRPGDRAALRGALGLPPDDVLILVSSVIVDGPDKGFADLKAALQAVAGPGVGVVAIGRLDDPARLGVANLYAPGLIADEALLAAWYGACDLHVTASRHETLGQTPIEAGLCGVPTLAYRTSGLTSAVIDGVSGRLVPVRSGALAEALAALVGDREARTRLGAFARIALESRYSPATAALSLDAVFRRQGLPSAASGPRFAPEMLGHFPFAATLRAGAGGTVPAVSRPLVRRLRRAKQMVFGRRMPLLVRRCLYLAGALRRNCP
ncbi:glycosyltransferase [Methylobacterium sp. NMS14P]|uniref:glycosyltransferase n=1 Tax=Methylobacterium sp. NMS14P TaxID=2894310 RepID=UPI00235A25EC|nr:glycosyltransferase [Methylobacterium sp. NMS14P]WCS24965.1 glycosyltransferase [Methylobacterium sp. NMS14P]